MRRRLQLFSALFALASLAVAAPAGARAGLCDALKGDLVRGGGNASGLLVAEAGSGRVVCRRAAGVQRPLASNMKLFTTSTALARLGPESRIETTLLASGRLDPEGCCTAASTW